MHRLRAAIDAILVGSGTALADDPELTARRGGARRAAARCACCVDSRLRVPPRARLFARDGARAVVLCATRRAGARGAARSRRAGARVLPIRARRGKVPLRARSDALAAARASARCWSKAAAGSRRRCSPRDLVDELHWFAAPQLLGADARPAVGPLGVARLAAAPRARDRARAAPRRRTCSSKRARAPEARAR